VTSGKLPVARGILRSAEDELRRGVINRIICTLKLEFAWVERQFGVEPRTHLSDALQTLEPMIDDGLIVVDASGLRVTPSGRFFLRNVCMPFDTYLQKPQDGPVYSRTV
jgi:oxygen-independent coproporphyrinogen-3 oxidase